MSREGEGRRDDVKLKRKGKDKGKGGGRWQLDD